MDSLPSHHYDGAILIAPNAQEAYFRRYRKDHPEENFDVLDLRQLEAMFFYDLSSTAQEILASAGYEEEEIPFLLEAVKRVRYLNDSPALSRYFACRDLLEKSGALQVLHDPFSFFKGRKIIVRGYYDGKAIAEAMQELPNICVNFDFGMDLLKEDAPTPVTYGEALPLIRETDGPLYVIAKDGAVLPKEIADLPRLYEPFAPSEGRFLVYGSVESIFQTKEYACDEDVRKALRLPTLGEMERRLTVERKYLLRSSRLLAYVGDDSRK